MAWIAIAAFLIGAYAAGVSLNVRFHASGYRFGSPRHAGVDGAVQRVIDGTLAMASGGILAARLSWIACAALVAAWTKQRVKARLNRWDLVLLLPLTILAYLVYVSNSG
jgi:hypothetical protein